MSLPKTLVILRGLPGSGKSTWIRERYINVTPAGLAPPDWDGPVVVSGDHFFTNLNGEYLFDKTKLGQAHSASTVALIRVLSRGLMLVIVDNTHSRKWEYAVAVELGRAFGYEILIHDLFDGGCSDEELAARNTHNTPVEVIARHRGRWEPES